MKGYKALNMDMSSKYGDMTYEIGKKYTIAGELKLYVNGYHFCKYLEDIEGHYKIAKSRIFEVEAEGEIIDEDDKLCAESITLTRELSKEEVHQYFINNQESILKKTCFHRIALADQELCLSELIHDENPMVRKAVARQGYGLDKLIYDENYCVRKEVARRGYGLNILIYDENSVVRMAIAKQGYGLDILVNDNSSNVRAAVAGQGYGLNTLVNDKDPWVRNAALNKLEALQ